MSENLSENISSGNTSPEHTAEEKDLLERSTKKQKGGFASFTPQRQLRSYKDSIIRPECNWDNHVNPNQIPDSSEVESDMEDDSDDHIPMILLSKEEKICIQAPWKSALIIKAFGKSIGFKFMDFKIRSLWKPKGDMQCMDLGLDFFLVRFRLSEDYWHVVNDGPWFIRQQFLAIRRWSPGFRPSEAKINTTAVWTRLPELPVELYDMGILNRIGNQLGTLLKVDARTVDGERGRFARLCIQIDLDQPLTPMIRIGDIHQRVQYEGISAICFHCGCVGHKAPTCPSNLPTPSAPSHTPTTSSPIPPPSKKDEKGFGEWMLVTRKKFAGLKVKPKSHHTSQISPDNSHNPSYSDPVKGKGLRVENKFRYDQNKGPVKNHKFSPLSPRNLSFQNGDNDNSMQTDDTLLTSSKVTIPLGQSPTDAPNIELNPLNVDNSPPGLLFSPNGECLSTQHRTHEKFTKPHSQNSIPTSEHAPLLDRSKIPPQTPVGPLATPMDLERYTTPHTSTPPHTDNSQPNTPHNASTLHTVTPSSKHHAASSQSGATQVIQTLLQQDESQNTDKSSNSPNTTHTTILAPSCSTAPEQLGSTTRRSTPPNREQPCALATELPEPLLDTDRGSTRESIEGTSTITTGKHTFRPCDNKPDSRISHSIPSSLSHRRDTTALEGTPSCYSRSPSPRKSSGWECDNLRAERHRSPRKPDNFLIHGKLTPASSIPCEGGEHIAHRSTPASTIIQALNGPTQNQLDSTHIL
jgi:hypothetical protein